METSISILIAVVVTAFFLRGYLKKLAHAASLPQPIAGEPAAAPDDGIPRPVINASLCIGCGSCVHECPEPGALALVAGKAILARPDLCKGHARCVEVCPTQGISLSVAGVLQTLKVPAVNEDFETNVPGVFIVGELGGVGLIKIGINEGRSAIDRLAARIKSAGVVRDDGEIYDVAIIGAGPAGLSATLAAHQHGLRYITLEQGEIASTIRHYPRQKLVFAEPIEMPLYGNLYIADTSKESLLDAWEKIIAETGVEIRTNARVDAVSNESGRFCLHTNRGPFLANNVVLATGKRGSPRQLRVPGEDLGKVAYRLIEAEDYLGKDILVVGGGDTAIECALALTRGSRNRVTLSYRGDAFKRLKQRNHAQLQAAEAEGRLSVMRKSQVIEIRPDSVLIEYQGACREIPNDNVFVLIGGESPDEFLKKIGIEIVDKAITAVPVPA